MLCIRRAGLRMDKDERAEVKDGGGMRPAIYVVILIIMFGFLLLSPYRWLIWVVLIFMVVSTMIRYLFWRNKFDYEE